MDKIIRQFTVARRRHNQIYPYTTWACVLAEQSESSALASLFGYLRSIFVLGVGESKGESVSSAPELIVEARKCESDLCEFARKSNFAGRGKFQHEIVQSYLMDNDPSCLATEVPVFDEQYLGHIDILRYREGRIEVADFKPAAQKEKRAASQIARYRRLLSQRTHIPENLIDAIYFDEKNSYSLTSK